MKLLKKSKYFFDSAYTTKLTSLITFFKRHPLLDQDSWGGDCPQPALKNSRGYTGSVDYIVNILKNAS